MEILVRCSALVSLWQQMKLEIWCGWAHHYKTIAKLIVHSRIKKHPTWSSLSETLRPRLYAYSYIWCLLRWRQRQTTNALGRTQRQRCAQRFATKASTKWSVKAENFLCNAMQAIHGADSHRPTLYSLSTDDAFSRDDASRRHFLKSVSTGLI